MIYTSIPKRKAKKPTAAQRQLEAEWDAIQAKYAPKKALKRMDTKFSYSLPTPIGRTNTHHIPSLSTAGGTTSSKPTMQYTGDKMLGIGTLHKSNAVPVFSDGEAKEMARMRRG
jgi:hypothetical protein